MQNIVADLIPILFRYLDYLTIISLRRTCKSVLTRISNRFLIFDKTEYEEILRQKLITRRHTKYLLDVLKEMKIHICIDNKNRVLFILPYNIETYIRENGTRRCGYDTILADLIWESTKTELLSKSSCFDKFYVLTYNDEHNKIYIYHMYTKTEQTRASLGRNEIFSIDKTFSKCPTEIDLIKEIGFKEYYDWKGVVLQTYSNDHIKIE